MRSGWIRYERIAGSLRCHRHGVKQQVFCKGDPEKLSCLRQQALCRVPDSKGRGRHLQNRKIRGETPLMERGLGRFAFCLHGQKGDGGPGLAPGPVARPHLSYTCQPLKGRHKRRSGRPYRPVISVCRQSPPQGSARTSTLSVVEMCSAAAGRVSA